MADIPVNDWRNRIIVADEIGLSAPPDWLVTSYATFRERVVNPLYPCYFGGHAERNGEIYYSYVENSSESAQFASSLQHFTSICRQLGSNHRNNLAVFFKQEDFRDHDECKSRVFSILQSLKEHDPGPQSAEIPDDPHHYLWEFGFGGKLFFIVALSPTYVRRKSRNMGPNLILLFQPREVFKNPHTGEALGIEALSRIRERLRDWDDVEAHPDLGVYGDPANLEWKQYVLSDDMKPETGVCPFSGAGSRRLASKVQV